MFLNFIFYTVVRQKIRQGEKDIFIKYKRLLINEKV